MSETVEGHDCHVTETVERHDCHMTEIVEGQYCHMTETQTSKSVTSLKSDNPTLPCEFNNASYCCRDSNQTIIAVHTTEQQV